MNDRWCFEEWQIIHVLPVNDTTEHEETTECKCRPIIKTEGESMIVIHNSYDGREGLEWAKEILNPK